MLPIIVPVELISYMIRPFSLALRLFVAMTAGHILLKVLAGFIVGLGATGGAAAFVTLPTLALLVGISALELLVAAIRSEEHTSELQSLMRISYAVFCLKKKNNTHTQSTRQY